MIVGQSLIPLPSGEGLGVGRGGERDVREGALYLSQLPSIRSVFSPPPPLPAGEGEQALKPISWITNKYPA